MKNLALTKDATDLVYKKLVEHLEFKSKSDVESVCAELVESLKAQGWTSEGRDLIRATSSILKRKRGDATLTIFVKPDKEGSQVRIFTEGLFWASLAESMGESRLGKFTQSVKEGDLDALFGAKAIGLSHGQFGFVVEALHSTRGDGTLGAEPVE